MNLQQIEEMEGLKIHNEPKGSLSDAIGEYLDQSIKRLDEMFLLICKTRASYIQAMEAHKKEDFVESHDKRVYANAQLHLLDKLLKKNFIPEK